MSVEDSTVIEQTTNAVTETPIVENQSPDRELEAIWDRVERDNGAARDERGKFTSANKTEAAADGVTTDPLEGGEGEAADTVAVTSTPEAAVEVPLPSNWRGLEETWAKIPAELRDTIKAHEDKIHQTLSTQGQTLAAFKPIGDVIQNYSDFFDGRTSSYKPHEAIDYLFNLQREMDANPEQTLLKIADTYNLRGRLAELDGQPQQTTETSALLNEINQLKRMLSGATDPSRIDERITEKLKEDREFAEVNEVISRVSKEMPLYDQVPEQDLVYFIEKARGKLGEAAPKDAVLKSAYDMAINADPDLRAKAAALKSAATNDPARVAAAKRANETNIRSTSTGKTRDLTEEEELGAVFDKNQRG